jgi:type I restriction enzyme S subunit
MEVLQPNLRFSEFDVNNSQYKKHLFKDIFAFSTGKNIKQKEASPEFQNPCVRYGELYHMYNEVITTVINSTNLDKSELVFSEGNEILLPSAGEDPLDIGSASALTVKNVAIGRTINILKPLKDNIYNQIYASYYINHKLRKKISCLAKGVSISNVYNSDLKTLDIILPSVVEQTKIANFLSEIDEKTNLLKENKSLLEEYKKGIMQKIFNRDLKFKDDNDNNFEDWNKVPLSNVFDYKKGSGLSKDKLDKNGNNSCILYGQLYTTYREVIFNVISKTNSNEGLLSEIGDLLIPASTTTSGIDLANVTALNFDNILLGGDITVLRSNQNVNSVFYAYYLSNHKKEEIASYAQGITIVHLYYSHIKDMIIDYPNIKEQTKIANFLSSIDEKIKLVNTQIQDTQEYKKGLLQQMFV